MTAEQPTPARGRGRPRIGVRVPLTLPEDLVAALDEAAEAAGVTRTEEARRRLVESFAPPRRRRRTS